MRIRAKLAEARDEELDKGIATWSSKDVGVIYIDTLGTAVETDWSRIKDFCWLSTGLRRTLAS